MCHWHHIFFNVQTQVWCRKMRKYWKVGEINLCIHNSLAEFMHTHTKNSSKKFFGIKIIVILAHSLKHFLNTIWTFERKNKQFSHFDAQLEHTTNKYNYIINLSPMYINYYRIDQTKYAENILTWKLSTVAPTIFFYSSTQRVFKLIASSKKVVIPSVEAGVSVSHTQQCRCYSFIYAFARQKLNFIH